MSWGTPLTAVANTPLDASQWNASVRDNLKETVPAKATAASRIIVTNAANSITERQFAAQYIDDSETTTSTSYVNLGVFGPSVSVTSGPHALVWIAGQLQNSGATNTLMTYDVTGATTDAAAANRSIECDGGSGGASDQSNRWGVTRLQTTNAGVNVFTCKYRVTGGTGTFRRRRINVLPL